MRLQFEQKEFLLGNVISVDTASVIVKVEGEDTISDIQVNRLVSLHSGSTGQFLIGIIQKITRRSEESEKLIDGELNEEILPLDMVKIVLIGTYYDSLGCRSNVFRRSLETVPKIGAGCFKVEGELLTQFMRIISDVNDENQNHLTLGTYTIDNNATAYLNGDKLFQRHAVIVGSTGSGKSWTTATIIQQAAALKNGNAILFDIHNEYKPLQKEGICHFKIAGVNDIVAKNGLNKGVIYLPFWLLGYEDIISMLVDRSDNNAPNQAMMINKLVNEAKNTYLKEQHATDIIDNFTIDSPIPFSLQYVIKELKRLDEEMIIGTSGRDKQGEFYGKFTRLIARIEAKSTDRRFGFMFGNAEETYNLEWLKELCIKLVSTADNCRVKIIDFSEVPSDILPLIVSLVARIIFSIQQWTPSEKRHPISLFCDEAHLYIPDRSQTGIDESSLKIFERIAKEGRKYGVGLVVITQRPSEVSRTVLSQCNNFIAMRLTNAEDQSVIKRLLPDSLGGFGDVLPVLDAGEALVVGDATILPIRVRVNEPEQRPDSGTIPFWTCWSKSDVTHHVQNAVESWRLQSLKTD